jgi:microsomal dipeptidase-like Zn-dependent dipeptidase
MDGIGTRKYKDQEIEDILGGNAIRLLMNGWKR